MDNPNFSPGKRPFNGEMHSSTLEQPVDVLKRRKYSNVPRSLDEINRKTEISFQQPFSAPILHSVPPSILPIIYPPLQTQDFFTDVTTDVTDPNISKQIKGILQNFPPPIPPYLSKEMAPPQGGMMIPFIYPPPPVITSETPVVGPIKADAGIPISPTTDEKYVEMPPLPFPPPNYMPYPLISDQSSLTPNEVFASFLEALQKLPRIDMVLASAAGSLFDLRIQADEEGFTYEQYEIMKSKKLEALKNKKKLGISTKESESEDEEFDSDDLEDYMEYASNVDVTDAFDSYAKLVNYAKTFELDNSYPPEYLKVTPNTSDIKSKRNKHVKTEKMDDEYVLDPLTQFKEMQPLNSNKIMSHSNKDISSANGINKEKRRKELEMSVNELSEFESNHKHDIYITKKKKLLDRLQNLKDSKIQFLGSDDQLKDEELLNYKKLLEERRDEELVRLKINFNYQYLKNLLIFYQESNKVYKNVNALVLNKLMKLKNFFEFQKNIFEDAIKNGDSKDGLFDVKSKESTKLFNGISERDFNTEVKQIMNSTRRENEKTRQSGNNAPVVHDYMPLISANEFNIITGDLPSKSKQSKDSSKSATSKAFDNIKHHIFQSSLYDPITSGSDTNNASESTTGTPSKRRGRRGGNNPGDKLIDDSDKSSSKYTESLLLAKIMKHFTGPQGANPDELTDDLEIMGVKTRWPIQYTK